MLNRFIYSLLLLGCAASALVGCTDDPDVEPLPSTGDGSPSWVTIDFCDNSFDKVNITTRATLDKTAESRVSNLFVFLFDENGARVYGRFFDVTNRLDTEAELLESKVDSWWVTGNAADIETEGKVRIYAPEVTGGSLYILTNINADMVNIAPDKLRFVQKLSDLEAMTATLNQEISERNGFFPMTGSASGITVSKGDIKAPVAEDNPDGQKNLKVMLTRLDAKVEVRLRVAKGYEDTITPNENAVKTYHKIDSFVPLSWQVVNLPRTAFVLPQTIDAETKMFSTRERKFETREPDKVSYEYKDKKSGEIRTVTDTLTEAHGFSFYMLENRPAPDPDRKIPEIQVENEGKGYHARETRVKDVNGAYVPDPNGTGDIWKYAPAEGTYLIIKGEVVMAVDVDDEGRDQQLSADVVYYIHLGDFGKDINNYDILRNTSYTYTITIYGVNNIQIEVEKKREENESGATGHVYVAKEQILTLDSHYCRAVVSFDEAHLTGAEDLLWYVKTPFGREGSPNVIGGIEVPSGLDYQWVHFIVNEIGDDGKYSKKHAWYNPEKVMNILEFSKYIKEQKAKFDDDKAKGKIDTAPTSDFRGEIDEDWKKKFPDDASCWKRYRIYMTVFVDEFYYTADPVTGDTRQDLWKDFVNQPKRLMHILCDADKSADEASRMTGSVLTIRQRSIQTVFNVKKPELKTAWGCETIDETRDSLWYYSRKESYVHSPEPEHENDPGYMIWQGPSGVSGIPTHDGNTSQGNGLYNTAKIWGLLTGADNKYTPKYWRDYVDFNQPYGLRDRDDTETLRYACMTRNRDENGNGIIDAAEVKWYLASITQLTSLYIGDQGIDQEAVMYPYYKEKIKDNVMDKTNAYTWRMHMVSSTATDSGWPEILWAEEGLSTGAYCDVYGKSASLTVRCVRNLGMDLSSEEKAQERLANSAEIPAQAIQAKPADGNPSVYRFDMINMNPMSVRYYTSRELEPNSGRSLEARVYWAFETGPLMDKTYSYTNLYNLLREGKSPCPEGYRVPNIREGALMSVRCPSVLSGDGELRVSTWFSRGSHKDHDVLLGTEQDHSNSWYFNSSKIRLDDGDGSGKIRCVKDIRQ